MIKKRGRATISDKTASIRFDWIMNSQARINGYTAGWGWGQEPLEEKEEAYDVLLYVLLVYSMYHLCQTTQPR
jgi:hypothetical protein